MSGWIVYLITTLSGIKDVLSIIAALSSIVLLIFGFFVVILKILEEKDDEDGFVYLKSFLKLAVLLTIIAGILYCVVPSTKDAVLIYIIPKVTSNERMQQVPDKILDLLDSYIKKGAEE